MALPASWLFIGPLNLPEKGHSGQLGQLDPQPHSPGLPQPPLAGTSFVPRDHLLNSPQRRGQLPAPSAGQSGLTLPLVPACPLPHRPDFPSLEPTHPQPRPPPLPLRNFARMGHRSSGFGGKDPNPEYKGRGAWILGILGFCQFLRLL